jgi:tetratricopeptide (TPR) repeat protein
VALARKEKEGFIYFDSRREDLPADQLTDFYLGLLKVDPALNYWSQLAVSAAQSGKSDAALKLAEDSLTKPDLKPDVRAALKQVVAKSKLANDMVEEGIAALRETAKGKEAIAETELALLGAALKRPELMKEAAALAKARRERAVESPHRNYHGEDDLALLLAENGLPEEGLELAAKTLEKVKGEAAAPSLSAMATIYVKQGKATEALTLMERSPDWGIDDVARSLGGSEGFSHGYSSEALPLGYIAAAGLAAAGREAEARTVLQAFIRSDPGNDRAYELLLKLDGQKAMETLDALIAIDQFEERPLIWKAVLLKEKGDLDAAEKTARQAISIDPSDGEQGRGDRLRAYAVLADIEAARGHNGEAETLRGAVKSIRLSEEADLDFAAGLLRRAISKYRESLKLFADAYCVQARLAVQMAAIGMNEDAEAHYRRAFELMPESFGRVESHCFGCEGAFGGEKAQGIAERTFNSLLQKTPGKPQLHYLLGYLRNQQGRPEEAVPHLRQAVKLDPDYLNAWKLLHELSQRTKMAPAESDDAVMNLLRLDPSGRHSGYYSGANDLARLWKTVREISPRIVESPTKVFRLIASAEAVEKMKALQEDRYGRDTFYSSRSGEENRLGKNPAVTVSADPIIQASASMILESSQF